MSDESDSRHRGRGTRRYVEASLLLLLAGGPAHGYDLTDRLESVFPLLDSLPDVSTVYRTLAAIEAQGAVSSEWTPGDGGGRKVYEITEAGRDLLRFWKQRFIIESKGLDRLLAAFADAAP